MLKAIIAAILSWFMERTDQREIGEMKQENADLKETNRVLKTQRDSLVIPPPDNPFSDGKF